MNRKEIGSKLEREIKKHFEALGCYCMKSGGSRGVADLAVFPMNGRTIEIRDRKHYVFPVKTPFLIQCKRTKTVNAEEFEAFKNLHVEGTFKFWAWRERYERETHFESVP